MNFLKGCDIVTDNAAIQFEHANYQVDGLAILRDINDFFPEGKITALVGPSGAGKTTVFKLCNGLASPTSGKIYFNQKSVDTYEPVELRRRIRSEEHTSELQSRGQLVYRLLLEKKQKNTKNG